MTKRNTLKTITWVIPTISSLGLPAHAVTSIADLIGTWTTNAVIDNTPNNDIGALFRSVTFNADSSFSLTESTIIIIPESGTTVTTFWQQIDTNVTLIYEFSGNTTGRLEIQLTSNADCTQLTDGRGNIYLK